MEHQPGAFAREYSAFISYSHRDRKVAERLGARIESYRLPKQIARRLGFARLKPVFRDREELTAAADLDAEVQRAILQSDFLIVVCTRHTPDSRWVGKEIALFRAAHGDDHILAAQFDSFEAGCFHSELRHRTDGSAVEPIAADFDPDGDGPRLALIKLVARLAGVGLDDLIHRDAQRRTRQLALAASFGLVMVMAIASAAILTFRAQAIAAQEQQRSSALNQFQLTETRKEAQAIGNLGLSEKINEGMRIYFQHAGNMPQTLEMQLQRAMLGHATADDDEKRGDYIAFAHTAGETLAMTRAMMRANPGNDDILFAHAQSVYWAGFAAWRNGDPKAAEAGFSAYAELAQTLAMRKPGKPAWRLERGYADSNLGMFLMRESHDWARALERFTRAQRTFEAVLKEKPGEEMLEVIADSQAWLADASRLAGALDQAEAHRRSQQMLLAKLLARAPRNAFYRVALLGNQIGLARIEMARGARKAAAIRLASADRIAHELRQSDPENGSIKRQQRAVELFTAQNWLDDPRRSRADAPKVAALLDCAPDWKVTKGEELATFCSLLSAKWALRRGQKDVASRIIADPAVARTMHSNTLSQRWQLDFADEGRKLEAWLGRPVA